MKQHQFEQQHQATWHALEEWLQPNQTQANSATTDTSTQKAVASAAFPQRYRQVCQHLALARDRHYTPFLVERLNRLVLSGHQRLYTLHSGVFEHILRFIAVEFPTIIRQEAWLVLLASVLFFGSFIGMIVSIQLHPELIYNIISSEQVHHFEDMYDPELPHFAENRSAQTDFMMFGYYIYNNIGIDFQVFAGGILFGLGTVFFLLFNGIYLGAVTGHLLVVGYHESFLSFVAGHSALELIALTLAGVAGLKLAQGIIAPGRQPRLVALKHAALRSVKIIYGVAGMSLLAAFIEAFWSSNHAVDPVIKYSVGISLWVLVISYFFIGSRGR